MFEIDQKRQTKLNAAISSLASPSCRWISLNFFTNKEVIALRNLACSQKFRKAKAKVSYRANQVYQDFDVCFPAPRIGSFDQLATSLEGSLFAAGLIQKNNPFQTKFYFDDFAIQRYPVGSRGIGIHRDAKRYKHIVVIINLAGQSRLFSAMSREGATCQRIEDRPGHLVLLSAEGFAGRYKEDARPLHGVDQVDNGRLSIGFRSTT